MKKEDVKEVVEFWDQNGFGFSNVHAKATAAVLVR